VKRLSGVVFIRQAQGTLSTHAGNMTDKTEYKAQVLQHLGFFIFCCLQFCHLIVLPSIYIRYPAAYIKPHRISTGNASLCD
jgi:hypothetical protein